MTNKELIFRFMDGIRTDVIADLKSKNLSDGDLGMVSHADDDNGALTGAAYYYQLVHGRKPGKQPPIESILGWIQKKGIAPEDISERSLAFLIARKIGKVGTDIYEGKREGLSLDEIIAKNYEEFKTDIDEKYLGEIKQLFSTELKQIFA